ncbi:MAG: aminopeptidase P family protein [Oscillospiraceae bacterium]|nr:aminopeptidase P family protein [Oscillospiraceae bacterium]
MNRLEALRNSLPEDSCALITSDVNRRYFTGMKSSAGTLIVFKKCAFLIIDSRYFEKAEDTVTDCEVILQERLCSQLSELIANNHAEQIMVESDTMTLSEFERLRNNITGAVTFNKSADLSRVIGEMRMIKSDSEIALMEKAQRIAEKALDNALNFIKEGVTEREIALCLDEYMLRNGAEALSFETIALCGETTSMPHGVPSDRQLKKGEFILMDFGAAVGGYHSDMTRTVALGDISEEMEKAYSVVLEAQNRAISAACEGITGKRLDCVARDFIAANGYGEYFGHGLGHCVGMEIHEAPCANTRDETILKENMVITIEPGVYLPKKFGIRIEDFVVIKQNSCYNLTNAPKNLIKL